MKVSYGNKMSISFSKAKKTETSLRHNNRDFTEKEKESFYNKHVDFSRSDQNKTLVKKDIREAYDEIFGEALKEYNAKQKRDDRKIDDYYSKVFHDKKLSTQREFLIQVGKKEDFEDDVEGKKWDVANKILEDYCTSFEERNPNFRIYNAVIHNDEACPHLHLNVVPIAEGYKRGLQKQPSFDKALRQQFGMDQEDSGSSFDVFKTFRDQEVSTVEASLEKNKISRLEVGTNAIENHHEYKRLQRELENKERELEELEEEFEELEENVSLLKNEKSEISEVVEDLKWSENFLIERSLELKTEKIVDYNVPNIPKDKYAVISRDVFEKLKEQNELVPVLLKKNKELSTKNELYSTSYDLLFEQNKQQEIQISRLHEMLNFARRRMDEVVNNGYDLWNRVMTYASKFHSDGAKDLPSDMIENDVGEMDFQEHQIKQRRFNNSREMEW